MQNFIIDRYSDRARPTYDDLIRVSGKVVSSIQKLRGKPVVEVVKETFVTGKSFLHFFLLLLFTPLCIRTAKSIFFSQNKVCRKTNTTTTSVVVEIVELIFSI